MNKIKEIFLKVMNVVKPKLSLLDAKFQTFMPNPKLRKITYIAISSLFGFMFLIIFLGLFLSPLRTTEPGGTVINKPNIVVGSPTPEPVLSATQAEILRLETKIKEMRFPESILNIPVIEKDITI